MLIKHALRYSAAVPELTPITGMSGWTRANNSRILAALTALKAGTADARVQIIGDSTSAGFGANAGSSGWAGCRWLAPAVTLAAGLVGLGVPAVSDNLMGKAASAANFTAYIAPETLTLGANWGTGLSSMGGNDLAVTSVPGVGELTYFSQVAMTGLRVTTYQYTAAGAISYEVTFNAGGTWVGPGGAGVAANNGLRVDTFVNPGAASQTVGIRRLGGAVNIQGLEPLITATKKLRIENDGVGSSLTSTWVDTTAAYSPGNVYDNMASHLAIINLTINDRAAAADPTVSMANLATMITNLHAANTDVWLVVPNPGNNVVQGTLDAYRAAIIAQAAASGVPCLDLMNPLNTLALWQAPTNMMFDGIHPNDVGYVYIGGQRYAAPLAALYAAA